MIQFWIDDLGTVVKKDAELRSSAAIKTAKQVKICGL
jgi:hypothetical protein